MHLHRILTFALIITAAGCLAQGDPEPKPLQPSFSLLTLNPGTGTPTLTWTPPSYNPLIPDPTGYIIYKPFDPNDLNLGWTPIQTVDASTFTYTDLTNNGLTKSILYRIASKGPDEPSPLTPPHGSIYVTAKYDSCANKIDIEWNHYLGWGNRIDYYNIYIGENSNWELFTLASTSPGIQNFAYYEVLPNKDYYIYIEAKKREEELYSKSNITHINTRRAIAPEYMYVDSLIAKDHQNEIHFRIDPNTEFRNFKLVRWESADSITSIFTATTLLEFTDPNLIYYADAADAWATRTGAFYYKLKAYNGCNKLKKVSNLSNTIIIRAYSERNKPVISWDKFYSAQGNTVRYDLYRIAHHNGSTETELIYQVEDPIEEKFIDNVSMFEGQNYRPYFCYYVQANEILGGGEEPRVSRSRTVCTRIDPDVSMPNAIDPLSTITRNGIPRNIFAPTINYKSTYKLTIHSRGGSIVFEGNNEGWNGRLPNGKLAPESTYVYRLEVMSEAKKVKSITGTVTVMYGPQ